MTIFIKNDTVSSVVWVGQTIAADAYYEVQPEEVLAWSNDETLDTAIGAGDAIVATASDGLEDIENVTEARAALQPKTIQTLISVLFSLDKARDEWMWLGAEFPSNDSPYIIPFPCILKSLTFSTSTDDYDPTEIQIFKNGSEEFTWDLDDVRKATRTIEFGAITFVPGDTLSIFAEQIGDTQEAEDVIVNVNLGVTSFDVTDIESASL